MIVDTVFEMSGGVERLADWADRNYGDFIQSVWVKGLPKAVATEHTVGSGVEDVLARLEAKEAEAEARTIDITPRSMTK